jgi:hypothetical protein
MQGSGTVKKTITMGLAVTMLFALTASSPAAAHERTEKTKISISPKAKTIDEGDKVKFQGKLKSDWDKCFAHQTVTLYKGSTAVLSTETSSSGSYKFTRSPRNTNTWHVAYAGRSFGTHPHVHRCLSSESKDSVITVN